MTTLVTKRWRGYGKDRLYVNTEAGEKVGWVDLIGGGTHLEPGADQQAFNLAVTAWRAEGSSEPRSTQSLEPAPASPTPVPAVTDSQLESPVSASGYLPASEASAATIAEEEQHGNAVASCVDLAANRAGAGPREQALAHKQAAPVRTLLARVLGVHTDERAWRVGAVGEEKVGAQLAKLSEDWKVLHGIPVGDQGSDIDHVVIGPGGVYTLNAKRHPGAKIWVAGRTFMVNGHKQPYIRNSEFEAGRAARLLTAACGFPVSAVGVIVPVDADDIVIRTAPEAVHVVNRMRLVKWLRARPELLGPAQVEAIFTAARRLGTWQRPTGR
jgi:hypothetical protein